MKNKIKLIILTCEILTINAFSYASTAIVRGSRPAIQLAGNNLMNLITPSIPSTGSQFTIPTNPTTYLLQPVQTYQPMNLPTQFKHINFFSTEPVPKETQLIATNKTYNKLSRFVETEQQAVDFFTKQIKNTSLNIPTEKIAIILSQLNSKQTYKMLSELIKKTLELKLTNLNETDEFLIDLACKKMNQAMLTIASDAQRESFLKQFDPEGLCNITEQVKDTKGWSFQKLYQMAFTAQEITLRINKGWKNGIDPEYISIAIDRAKPIMNEAVITNFLKSTFANEPLLDINIPLISRLAIEFSQQQLVDTIKIAQKIAGNNPVDTLSIRQAILDVKFGEKKPIVDKSQTNYKTYTYHESPPQEIIIHYEKGRLRSVALHEASHAIAQIESSVPYFVSTLTIEPRRNYNGLIQPARSYANIKEISLAQQLKKIIICLAGTVGEQIFDTYRYQGYSQAMLTDKDEIFTFLSSRIGAIESINSDMEQAKQYAKEIAIYQDIPEKYVNEKITEIIADCYIKTYRLINENKNVIEKLANAAMKKETLYEDEIYEIAGKSRPLHDFESGAMTESESAALSQYRFPRQAIKMDNRSQQYEFGYDGQNKYIGSEGYRDKQDNLFEID